MSESKEERISRLMEEGLRHHGEGRTDQAAACWHQVLCLDPGHSGALDSLRSARSRSEAIGPSEDVEREDPGLLTEALELFRRGEADESLEMLETLAREDPGRMEIQGYLELVRSHLFERYRAQAPEASSVLKVAITPEEMMRFNLPANAGFVLSMIDGSTSVNEILALSGMDPFEALRTVEKLLEAGIVEVNP
jgi:hypothetical protein